MEREIVSQHMQKKEGVCVLTLIRAATPFVDSRIDVSNAIMFEEIYFPSRYMQSFTIYNGTVLHALTAKTISYQTLKIKMILSSLRSIS